MKVERNESGRWPIMIELGGTGHVRRSEGDARALRDALSAVLDKPVLVFVFDPEQDGTGVIHSAEPFQGKTTALAYEQGIDDGLSEFETLSWPFDADDLEDIAPDAEPEDLETLMAACVARAAGLGFDAVKR